MVLKSFERKNAEYYVEKIKKDIEFVISKTEFVSLEDFSDNEVLSDSVCFRFIQISENAVKLKRLEEPKYMGLPYSQITGMRNLIVHEYGKVDFSEVLRTAQVDLPNLLKTFESIETVV
ncbi:MAG: DUF86 domain-containing protein [Bacilli bacterium]|nr:DUF86 domain-containing protein [Bacilli bacterium]